MSERERLTEIVDDILERRREERQSALGMSDMMPITGSIITAEKLSPQLGTSPEILAKGKFDMRILSVITKRQLMALVYLYQRGKRVKCYKEFVENFLNFSVSVGARGRKDLIKMQAVSVSGSPEEEAPERPGWIGRHITQRNWREESE